MIPRLVLYLNFLPSIFCHPILTDQAKNKGQKTEERIRTTRSCATLNFTLQIIVRSLSLREISPAEIAELRTADDR